MIVNFLLVESFHYYNITIPQIKEKKVVYIILLLKTNQYIARLYNIGKMNIYMDNQSL